MTQDYRQEKEECKETMALEAVTDGKMTKLKRMSRNMYTTREHGACHAFCFVCVLIDNKYILSCAIIKSK